MALYNFHNSCKLEIYSACRPVFHPYLGRLENKCSKVDRERQQKPLLATAAALVFIWCHMDCFSLELLAISGSPSSISEKSSGGMFAKEEKPACC
jgi:hypothetical protein